MAHLPRALQSLVDLPDAERRIGPFRLVAPLGRGGFAPVWLAREVYGATELRTAAVKLFSLEAPDGKRAGALYRDHVIDEARALCRVEHPNIVRFFALPTDAARNVMGLAMEHVAGTSLDRRLAQTGTLSAGEALGVGAAVASALAAVHRAGLVHRDVKPANIVEAGEVYKLIDFGIAAAERVERAPRVVEIDELPIQVTREVRSSGSGPSAGTFGYVDPACLADGTAATPASDLYSLGATLFECLTGRLPCAARGGGVDGAVVEGRRPAAPLLDLAPNAPPPLARLVDALLAPDRADRPPSAGWVAIELERLRIALAGLDRALPPEEVGPFRGLGRFEESDRDVYFGRAGEVAAALDMLRGRGTVALIGPSGSGKSSLARAGVLPRVAEGALGGWPKQWDTAIVSPGSDAKGAIVAALTRLDPPVAGAVALRPEALVEALVGRAVATERGLVLLVDQLEELVTLGGGDGRDWAVEVLARIGETAVPGLRVLTTVRRDLLDPLLGLGDLGKTLVRGSLLVSPLSDAAWGEVLDEALSAYRYALEDDALRGELLAELSGTASAMPLVQFALTELWHKRDRERKQITRAGLRGIGGIAGALGRHADATVDGLERRYPGVERAAREVLLALTTLQGTRAARAVADLERAGGALGREVLAALEAARLVVREGEAATLAHDVLIVQWRRLAGWEADARADRVQVEKLRHAAQEWEAREEAEDLLWRGRVAFEAGRWRESYAGELGATEERFLKAGLALAEALRRSEQDRDFRIAAGPRNISVALFTIAISAGFWASGRAGLLETTPRSGFTGAVVVVTALSITFLAGRGRLFKTRVSKQFMLSTLFFNAGFAGYFYLGMRFGLPVVEIIPLNTLVAAVALGVMGVTIHRWFLWMAAVTALTTIVQVVWPAYIFEISGSHFVVITAMFLMLRRDHREPSA